MGNLNDLTGQKYNKLTVISKIGKNKQNRSIWLCRCECGNDVNVLSSNLKNGHTKSCGCFCKQRLSESNSTHKLRNSRIYSIWTCIKTRCYNRNHKHFENYGGRGISVCNEWKNDFQLFYNWAMNNGYNNTLSIDRIDVNGNYEPNNCRFISTKEQARNRRNSVFIECNGKSKTLAEWCEITGLHGTTIQRRLKKGCSIERALGYE